jgi:thiamine transporter 2/3
MRISPDSYGLIFGINRFMALVFQTLLTLLITDKGGLALGERSQFIAYGSYHTGLGVFFAGAFLIFLVQKRRSDSSEASNLGIGNQDQRQNETLLEQIVHGRE